MWSLLQPFNSGLWCKSSHRPCINKEAQLWSNKILVKKQTVGQTAPWSRSFPKAFSGIQIFLWFHLPEEISPRFCICCLWFPSCDDPSLSSWWFSAPLQWLSCFLHLVHSSFCIYCAFWWSTSSGTFLRKGYLKSCISAHAFFLPSHLADNLTRCWIQGWNSLSCISFSLVVLSGRFLI